jgi:uncharacterized repeat protein (TIGR03803 family)
VFDSAGNLYGVTNYGGNPNTCNNSGCGVVYELSPSSSGWTQKILHTFTGGFDGGVSFATLIFDGVGNLYGTATVGGNLAACTGHSCGVVFRLSPQSDGTWKETTLHAFAGGRDGSIPNKTLVFDTAGNLYGTTSAGGGTSLSCFPYVGCGMVFELSPTSSGLWKETILRTFQGDVNGGRPLAGLTIDAAGKLYGTTSAGGYQGNGTVYRLSPSSGGHWQETVLYQFQALSSLDGRAPLSVPLLDAAGNIYGTTAEGGSSDLGTVFELSPSTGGAWTETLLHQFAPRNDGSIPFSGVVFDSAGNLWGTASNGGSLLLAGSVYELSPISNGTWNESAFYFDIADGSTPRDTLIFDAAGNLYGTTSEGGEVSSGFGVVFQIVP